jgi:hypothetical protein
VTGAAGKEQNRQYPTRSRHSFWVHDGTLPERKGGLKWKRRNPESQPTDLSALQVLPQAARYTSVLPRNVFSQPPSPFDFTGLSGLDRMNSGA